MTRVRVKNPPGSRWAYSMAEQDIARRPCQCGEQADEVIHAEAKLRRGWYCPACGHFEKAIGRERTL